jgi:hypothetical protein
MLLGGLFSILWGLALSGLGGLTWLTGLFFSDSIQAWGGNAFGGGLWSLLVGVVQIITAFGLFARQRWAWLLALISTGAALLTPLIGLINGSFWSLFGLVIPGIIFFYLLADADVKRAFGRA